MSAGARGNLARTDMETGRSQDMQGKPACWGAERPDGVVGLKAGRPKSQEELMFQFKSQKESRGPSMELGGVPVCFLVQSSTN